MPHFLKRFRPKFRALRWKLTFSYILITAVSLLVTILVAILILAQFVIGQYGSNASSALQTQAPLALYHLLKRQSLSDDVNTIDYSIAVNYDDPTIGIAAFIPPLEGYTVLLDPHNQVLASSDSETLPQGRVLPTNLPLTEKTVLSQAFQNRMDMNPVVTIDQQQTLYGAIALFQKRRLLGILLTVQKLPNSGQMVFALVPLLWPVLFFITGVVGLIGALFGAILSRWLVRRLVKVTQATESWSQGNFAPVIADRAGDELGVMTRQLNTMASKLAQLLAERQDVAVLEERNRMARDLHDSLKQQLFAIIMQVWSAQDLLDRDIAAARGRLDTIGELVGQTQQELATLIYQLRPVVLADKPFSAGLREYCEHWGQERQSMLTLDIADVTLSLKAEEALFRVTQEALANISRHSHARAVQVQLINQQEQIILRIVDDGQGFELERAKNRGIGLHSMQERMAMLHGSLTIESEPGHGTTISALYTKGKSSTV